MFKGHFKRGSVEGTGSAINVECGFTPDYVWLLNIDDAGSLWPSMTWTADMADASAFKTLAIVDSGSTAGKSSEKVTTNGITPYAGTVGSDSEGFTIGADTDVNASAETIVYVAMASE